MDRIEKSKTKFKQLFGKVETAAQATDPEFEDILIHFVFNEMIIRPTVQVG